MRFGVERRNERPRKDVDAGLNGGFAMYKLLLFIFVSVISGCAGSLGQINATDPTERGLSYVAAAIVTSAVIRAFFNK